MGLFSNRVSKKKSQKKEGNTPLVEVMPLSLEATISNLPPQQEADFSTQRQFVRLLKEKLQRYDSFPTSWTRSIFQQFYREPLAQMDAGKVLPEAKAYLSYFIFCYAQRLSPCLDFTARLDTGFTYGEILRMLEDIGHVDKALELVYRLTDFSQNPQAAKAMLESISQVHILALEGSFYEELQKRLCQAEVDRISGKYSRQQLPLLHTRLLPLQKALEEFSAAYALLLKSSPSEALAQSVQIKIVPLLNEITAYAQENFTLDTPKLQETIAAVNAVTGKVQRLAGAQQLEAEALQLDVNLELILQLSKD